MILQGPRYFWHTVALCHLACLGFLTAPALSQPVVIAPGEVIAVELDDPRAACIGHVGRTNIPRVPATCQVSTGEQRIVVGADAQGPGDNGLNFESQTGQLLKQIAVERASDPDEASDLVRVAFAGDFGYDGTLLAASGGIPPSYASVVANFKVFDTNSDGTIGNVVGSRIILSEVLHFNQATSISDLAPDSQHIEGSSAFDFSIDLSRGTSYFIVVELTCVAEVEGLAFTGPVGVECDFISDARGNFPGLALLSPITITARDDILGDTLPQLDQIRESFGPVISGLNFILGDTDAILSDTTVIKTDVNTALDNLAVIGGDVTQLGNDLSQHDAEIKADIADLRTRLMNLQSSVDANHAALLDIVRLLHTPSGVRSSELPACEGESCVWQFGKRSIP